MSTRKSSHYHTHLASPPQLFNLSSKLSALVLEVAVRLLDTSLQQGNLCVLRAQVGVVLALEAFLRLQGIFQVRDKRIPVIKLGLDIPHTRLSVALRLLDIERHLLRRALQGLDR